MEVIMDLLSQFGAWAVVVASLYWLAKFTERQLDLAREERQELINKLTEPGKEDTENE